MKYCLFSFIAIMCFSFGNSSTAFAQSDLTQTAQRAGIERYQDLSYKKRKKLVDTVVQDLKQGTLIVRLISSDSKIKYLEKVGRTEDAQKEKELAIERNQFLMSEFKEFYDYSDVVFTYGKYLKDYKENRDKPIFVDESLNIDEGIKIKEGPIFIFAAQAKDDFYLYDLNMNRIPEPAPHGIDYFSLNKSNTGNAGMFESSDRFFEWLGGTPNFETDLYYFNYKLHKIDRKSPYQKR